MDKDFLYDNKNSDSSNLNNERDECDERSSSLKVLGNSNNSLVVSLIIILNVGIHKWQNFCKMTLKCEKNFADFFFDRNFFKCFAKQCKLIEFFYNT